MYMYRLSKYQILYKMARRHRETVIVKGMNMLNCVCIVLLMLLDASCGETTSADTSRCGYVQFFVLILVTKMSII